MSMSGWTLRFAARCMALLLSALVMTAAAFDIEESTIDGLHKAIRSGETSCYAATLAYIERARAYNGVCTALVTADGASIADASGTLRARSKLVFPTQTVKAASILPDLDRFKGKVEYGHMQATLSEPGAQQQYGMVVGIPGSNQVSALSTLNLRGERSTSCAAECDTTPSSGALPASCPRACESLRAQPDALETARSLDARYGRKPDLAKMPMYCVSFSFKDVYDTRDMRSTGGADVAYAMDVPRADSTVVSELRSKGAIILAKANLAEYNGGAGDPGGDAKAATKSYGAGARSTWGGTSCNPFDPTRETGGSSAGSAASVGANLVACSICEETGGSCRQPAWRNGVTGLVTTKGLIGYGGAIGADPYLDRAGINCRSVRDTAQVLDALKSPHRGYFDPRDIYSALPSGTASDTPYADATKPSKKAKPLAGMRIGIVREYMVKHSANDAAISDALNDEIKRVLGDELGATLVESYDPKYPDDPKIPNMPYNFQHALAEVLPPLMPELLAKKDKQGKPLFSLPGYDLTSRDYMVKAAEGRAPWPENLNLRSINDSDSSYAFSYHFAQYLMRRADDRVIDWASLNANASYYAETRKAAMKNWENKIDIVSLGNTQDIKMREVGRLAVLKVLRQNDIMVFVNPTTTVPAARIGYASQPAVNSRPVGRFPTSANLGIPEITVPAGFNSTVYEPSFALKADSSDYESVANETQASTSAQPMPIGLSFWAGPGDEAVILKVAAAYENATQHRKAPPLLPKLAKK
ncbi:amidase family protein [Hydrocarboniphaga effusa]|uniref:amidase family protein n=1 Tax=Hydrocarboniphaga effusa TaxID=243629 RepID=UPI00398C0705